MNLFKYFYLSLLVITFICSGVFIAYAADVEEENVRQFMTTYFQALKGGDVNALVDMLADPLLGSRRILLEKNTAYPDHLKDYYRDANFAITAITSPKADMYNVNAEFIFGKDANSARSKFLLKNMNGQLKIFNEINDE